MNSHDIPASSSSSSIETPSKINTGENEEIIIEDSLAEAMLTEIQENKWIQAQLIDIAKILNEKIYALIIKALVDVDYNVNNLKKH